MLLNTTNYAIIHESLHFSRHVPVDKQIINQHVFHGGLKVKLNKNFSPCFYYTDFENYAPTVNNLVESLEGFWFRGREYIHTLIFYAAKRNESEEEFYKGLVSYKKEMMNLYGKKHATVIYADAVIEEKERFFKFCIENRLNKDGFVPDDTEYWEERRHLADNYNHVVRNHPVEELNTYIDSLPYTSNDDIVFDFYRKNYSKPNGEARDSLCNNVDLYGWVQDEETGFFKPKIHSNLDKTKPAHVKKFTLFVNSLIDEELKPYKNLSGEELKNAYHTKHVKNHQTFGKNYLFTQVYKSLDKQN